jgi:NAD(P)-dependent dehydrogenase (short-subunit alcohol dehydrogenase family)
MKIIVIGGTGTIGKAVVAELSSRHEVIVVGQSKGNFQCDIGSEASIGAFFSKVGKVDAVAIAAGNVHFAPFSELKASDYAIGLNHKLMGQVNVVLIGLPYVNDRGSFTLISGILNRDPIRTGASASMVNGALEGFVVGAAIEMPRGIRINVVSPTVITEAMTDYGPYFRGHKPVPAAEAALAFSKSIEGLQTGQVYRVGH